MTTLYRSKDNGLLYKLFVSMGKRPGVVTAEPFGHRETLDGGSSGLRLSDFGPERIEG
jgi:hypothetical protein